MTAAGAVPDVSLVIPAFNEAGRLEPTLTHVLDYLQSQPRSFEVIVVDDGSEDGTVEVVRALAAGRDGMRLHRQVPNQGKGEAVRQGMLLATGRYRFFSDADLSVPIEMLPAFLLPLERACDIAIASRRAAGAVIEVHQPRHRELLGRGYSTLVNWVLWLAVADVTCGFKGFRGAVAADLYARQRIKTWSFDAEILYLARRRGYRVVEVPVRWRNDASSRVRLSRDVLRSFGEVAMIRWSGWTGRYDP
ncbi:MAG: dolichyl-phosphate beta-glucosyltransferase [Candidatus Rokuibacteriota bacterium]